MSAVCTFAVSQGDQRNLYLKTGWNSKYMKEITEHCETTTCGQLVNRRFLQVAVPSSSLLRKRKTQKAVSEVVKSFQISVGARARYRIQVSNKKTAGSGNMPYCGVMHQQIFIVHLECKIILHQGSNRVLTGSGNVPLSCGIMI